MTRLFTALMLVGAMVLVGLISAVIWIEGQLRSRIGGAMDRHR